MFSPIKKLSRLSQWNGRRRSSRSVEPLLARLCQRRTLLLLLPVVLTVILAAWILYVLGTPMPYRLGEISRRDLRARVSFEVINQARTERKREEAVQRLPPGKRSDPDACEWARATVPPVVETYPIGTPLAQRGQPIKEQQLPLLEQEHQTYQNSLPPLACVRRGVALCLVLSLLAPLVVEYVARFQPGLAQSLPKIIGVCLLVIITLTFAQLLSRPPWYAVLVPLTMTALVLTIVYNPPFALLMTLTLSLATTVALDNDLHLLLVQMGGLATAVLSLRSVRTRTRLVEVGAAAGVAYALMTLATGLLSGQTWRFIGYDAGRQFLCGTLSGFLISGSLPLVERCFSIVTDISLLELADGSHPLLQELVRRAPGTYTHSMTVATLAEAAAESIGANPLLTRVGSYFHDVGKMLKPQYFIENQSGENRHDALEPALSTLIIIGHVKDGVALAEQYHLPRPIIEFIQQHHGTTLVEYFYREAMRQQETLGNSHVELESSFRYPGPKPQTPENGIVMLADAVESASRALSEPTPGSLRKLVHSLLMKRLLDGQFEGSGLTLTELHLIEESLSKSLIALYHTRVRYPETEAAEQRRAAS